MPFGQEAYGTPLREIAGQALQFKAGLGALQEQQRQQQAMQELDATWKQAGGDPAKFKEMGGYRFLSPQQAMAFENHFAQKAQQAEQSRQFDQTNARLIEQAEENRTQRGVDRVARGLQEEENRRVRAETAQMTRESVERVAEENRQAQGVLAIQRRLAEEARQVTPQAENKPPTSRTRVDGVDTIFEEWDGKRWVEVSRGKRFAEGSITDPYSDPQVLTAAKSIAGGRTHPEFFTKRGSFRNALVQVLEEKYPGVNLNELTGEAAAARNVNLNRSIAILDSVTQRGPEGEPSLMEEFRAAHKALGFTSYPAVNWAKRQYLQQTGAPELSRYDTIKNQLAMELGNALAGAALTDKRLEVERESLAKNPSYEQIEAATKALEDVIKARRREFRAMQGQDRVQRAAGEVQRIGTDQEYDALPSGAEFVGPDGKRRRKP